MENLNWKYEKIKALNDEVKELHPVLKALFEHMPQIKSVIYTQGNRENGADFVLVKSDGLLDLDDYVGVVVKSSTIRQNSDDVHRQIRECIALPRPIENGKKLIYLTEVWVVTNRDVTRNAEDHLHAEYKTTKIKFIDGEILVRLIDKYFDSYWKLSDVVINKYLAEQRNRLETISDLHRLLPKEFGRIVVEKDLLTNPPELTRKFNPKKAKPVSLWDEIKSKKCIFIEGGMGSGKSELLRTVALRLCDNLFSGGDNVVPFYITYREFSKKIETSSIKDFISDVINKVSDNDKRICILVDSLDESLEESSIKISKICNLAKEIYADDRISLTVASRIIDEETLSDNIFGCFDRYKVSPLPYSTIIKFIEKICDDKNVSSKLRSDLQNSPLMKALPRTPLSAILLGKLLRENIYELPATLPELYSKYVELVLGRWDLDKNGGSEKEYETLQRLTSMIAVFFLSHDLDTLAVSELKEMFGSYLDERRTGQTIGPMLNSFLSKSELISYDEEREVVAFRHKSFAEYFFAQSLLIEKGKNAEINNPFDVNWAGVQYFYLGLVRDAPERIKQLSSLIPADTEEEFLKMSQFGNFLMAAYQTPYEVIKDALYNQFREATRYYQGVLVSDTHVLKAFPELQVLAAFTHIMRKGYSYEFFRPALQDARIQAELDSGTTEEEKIVCIFLLDTILCSLNDKSAFVNLIDRHESALNWTVRLGIWHASADANFVNQATKAMQRKLEKSLKGNHALTKYIEVLESTPLSERKVSNASEK